MKNIIKPVASIVAFLFCFSANAQTKPLENSLLWEVSGKGLAKPSYLYGTMHMMCENDFVISEQTKKAFGQTQKLVLELDMDDPAELADMQKLALSEVPLSKSLTPTEYQKLDGFLKQRIGVGAAPLENYTLVSILSLVMIKAMDCAPKVYELEFSQMAAKENKEVLGLEKIAEQMAALEHSYTNAEMIEQLEYYDTTFMQQMMKVYLSQDLNGLYAMVIDKRFMDEDAQKFLLDSRNENWLTQMPAMMQKNSTFFAVGAGHLGGNKGIIALLRKAGYTVKPVTK